MNVMAPTMQVVCKAFIVPNPAARSPKERYSYVPRSLRRVRHAKCFNGECPSEATDKIGMRHIYWSAVAEMRHPYRRFHLCSCYGNGWGLVRFTPQSGHRERASKCPLCTNSGLMQCSKQHLYSITSSALASGVAGMSRACALAA